MNKLMKAVLAYALAMTIMPTFKIEAKVEINDGKIFDSGEPVTSQWVLVDNDWYMTDENGDIIKDKWVASSKTEWHYLGIDGKMTKEKWLPASNERWFYVDAEGVMAYYPQFINGKFEGFNSDGTWQKGNVNYKGVPIRFIGKYKEKYVNQYMKQLSTLPDKLTTIPMEYVFTDKLYGQRLEGSTYTGYDSRLGWYCPRLELSSISYYSTTLLHELMHGLDGNTGFAISDSTEFNGIVQKYYETFDQMYRRGNNHEYFAALVEDYYQDKGRIKEKMPDAVEYAERHLQNYGIEIPDSYYGVSKDFYSDEELDAYEKSVAEIEEMMRNIDSFTPSSWYYEMIDRLEKNGRR